MTQQDNKKSKQSKLCDTISIGVVILFLVWFLYGMGKDYKQSPNINSEINTILSKVHNNAEHMADTVDITKYMNQNIDVLSACNDSAYYTENIKKIIKNPDNNLLRYETNSLSIGGMLMYENSTPHIDAKAVNRNPELQKNIKKYQESIVKLALYRRAKSL